MSDHALRVYNQPINFAAIEAVLRFGDIALSSNDLAQLNKQFNQQQQSEVEPAKLVNDTRTLSTGDVFCAVIGSLSDGREHISQAIAANCSMVIQECSEQSEHGLIAWHKSASSLPVAIVNYFQLNENLFAVANAFYGAPAAHLNVIGITGTNGKTSTSQIIANLLDSCQRNCTVIGTNGAGKLDNLLDIANTTPGATELNQLLSSFAKQSVTDVAMEVSSHALAQKRVEASLFNTAVFTNLSRDHLDYHHTMSAYAEAKKQIFTGENSQVAVLNGDDQQAQTWLASWPKAQPVVVYGRGQNICQYDHYVQAVAVKHHTNGVSFTMNTDQGQCQVTSQLLGDFNVENLLAAIAVLMIEKIQLDDIAIAIKGLKPITGRMEAFTGSGKPTTVVDYAHTPDALASALDACRLHCQGKLWVVFGCGGDRDMGKRPLMAKVAESKADQIIITNDNPRSEDADAIAEEIIAGFSKTTRVEKILDRRLAINAAFSKAQPEDIILCAGKGHEDYIIFGDEKRHYDERALVSTFYFAGVAL